jgi:hypothetical protein
MLIAFNRGDKPFTWTLPKDAREITVVFATEKEARSQRPSAAASMVTLPPYSAAVLAEQ